MNAATLHHQRRPSLTKPRTAPMISVIIPAHNEEDYLRKTLEAVNRQSYRPYELIVVANGCSDRTPVLAHGQCHNLLVLRDKGLSRARNAGARAARGELLLFLDADTVLEADALEIVAQRFTRRHSAGTLKGQPDSDRLIYRLIYWIKNFQHRWRLHRGSSGVILCWKDDFEAMGGFDEALEVMENSDLIRKLKSQGKYLYVDATPATTSMRRYDKCAVRKACRLWFTLWLQATVGDVRHKQYETVR